LTDFRNFFTTIFSKELRNKNLLKFSPHLKSVAALPCETWNVKCVDIQQHHIQFKTDAKCQVTILSLSSSLFYIRCSKWPPFAHTQVVSRARHWSIASSMTFCPMLCHTHTQQALTQLVKVIYVFLVDPLLHYSPDLIIHGVHIWTVWGPLVGRNEDWRLSA